MPTYYLDSRAGSDSNDGTSRSAPWKTMAPLLARKLSAADLVLFKSGGVYDGGLGHPTFAPSQRSNNGRLTFGAYGSGAKPVLSGYGIIDPGAWKKVSDTVWQAPIDNAVVASKGRMPVSRAANIGFLEVDGVIRGDRKWQPDDLRRQWDFHVDYARSVLSVFATDAPGRSAGRIAAAPNVNAISGIGGSTCRDLEFHGFAGHGFSTYASDVTVADCSFHGIGGAQLGPASSRKRYGNGAQAWSGTSRVTISDCLFEDIYDVAFTCQGYPVSARSGGWQDIVFARNEVYRPFQAIEFWSRYGEGLKAGTSPAGSGFHNCVIEDNRFHAMDRAWSAPVRDDPDVGAALLLYMLEAPVNQITIRRNLFEGMRQMIYSRSPQIPSDIVFTDNEVIFDRPDRKLVSSRKETAAQFADFLRNTGVGKGCTVKVKKAPATSALTPPAVMSSRSPGMQVRALAELVIDGAYHDPLRQWIECGVVSQRGPVAPCDLTIDYALEGGIVTSHRAMGTLQVQIPAGGSGPAASPGRIVQVPLVETLAPAEPLFALVSRHGLMQSETRLFVNTATLAGGRLLLRPTAGLPAQADADVAFASQEPTSRLPAGDVILSRHLSSQAEAITGVGVPTSAPPHTGAAYVDLDGRTEYRAFGSTSRRDWIAIRSA